MKKTMKTLAIAVILILLTLPAIMMNLKKNEISETENRMLAEFPNLRNEDGTINWDFTREFDRWYEDHVGFRKQFHNLNAKLTGEVFQTSTVAMVSVGRDGWLFLTEDDGIEIAGGNKYLSENALNRIATIYSELQQNLEREGKSMVLLLVPDKECVYPEYMREGYRTDWTLIDQAAEFFRDNTDLNVINLKDSLLKEKAESNALLYWKTDTHWNDRGAYVGYQALLERLNQIGLTDEEPVPVSFSPGIMFGDLSRAMGFVDYREEAEYAVLPEQAYPMIWEQNPEELEKLLPKEARGYTEKITTRDQGDRKKVLIVGDSFGSVMMKFLAQNFSQVTCVRTNYPENELLEYVSPDVVIIEVVERRLEQLCVHNTFVKDGDRLQIYYYSDIDGKLWFPVWSADGGQDDLVWYESTRLDDGVWFLEISLSRHPGGDTLHVDVYQGEWEQWTQIDSMAYYYD